MKTFLLTWFSFLVIFAQSVFAEGSPEVLDGAPSLVQEEDAPHWRDASFDYRSEDPTDSLQVFSPLKFATVASVVGLTYGAAYLFIFRKGWWGDEEAGFHFENDFEYAKNLDKLGHFTAGVLMGEIFYEGYRWTGMSEWNAYLFAGLSGTLSHVAIDIKDGFSPEWGFSIFDVLFGSVGSFYPMAKRYWKPFNYIDWKMSYWINSHAYYDDSDTGVPTDDYVNQTYWLSLKVARLLPRTWRHYYPEWLAFAFGISIDDGRFIRVGKTETAKGHHLRGHYEFYLSLDYDLEAFHPHKRWARTLVKYLNYIKFPAPTLQFYPEVKFFWIYPIKF